VVNLLPPETVRKLQETLQAKAQRAPGYRFDALYDKVYRADVLAFAYDGCHAKGRAAGVDGQTFADLHEYGLERWLGELAEDLRKKTYRPQAVRRVYIPKPDGKPRPLGIPTLRDRVVQTAALLVVGPIFESDVQPDQHAYRPGQNAWDAVQKVHALLTAGHTEVVDADLSGSVDSIPHAELRKSVARRVRDRHLLALVTAWLEAPVEEADAAGRPRRTTRNKDEGRGCPQGAPLSPRLANLYMRRFILGGKQLGHERRLDAHIVNYADDFVICCRGSAAEALTVRRDLMRRLKLTVNETKTRRCRVPDATFDLLGYPSGRCYSPKTGRSYIGTRPSAKQVRDFCRALREQTSRRWTFLAPDEMVGRLHRMLVGWANYFCLGPGSAAYRRVDSPVCPRLRPWLGRKYHVPGTSRARSSDVFLDDRLGLVKLQRSRSRYSWANA
jgi:group II intron reverse transcriptase/maturase